MKIDYELSEKDYNSIADIVIKKVSDNTYMETLIETSRKVVENKYWHVFEKITQEMSINDLIKENISKTVLSTIKEEKLLENEIRKTLNVEELKKLGAKRLREIAYQLEKEAEELYKND